MKPFRNCLLSQATLHACTVIFAFHGKISPAWRCTSPPHFKIVKRFLTYAVIWIACQRGMIELGDMYEGYLTYKVTDAVTQQPLGAGHATIAYIKAMDVLFHLTYGSQICAKRLQSDRQNKEGCLQTPAGHKNMIIKYLSVGQLS